MNEFIMLQVLRGEKRTLIREGILFLARMGAVAVILGVVLLPFEIGLQEMVSSHAQRGLHALGTKTVVENTIQFWAENKLIEISPLCAGLVEIILFASAVFSTSHATLIQKIRGILVGVTLLYLFNVTRIIITVQQLIHTTLSFAEFTHDVLFRAVLIAGFAGIYYAWLRSQN